MEDLKNTATIDYDSDESDREPRSFSIDMNVPLLKIKQHLKFQYCNRWLKLETNSLSLIQDKLPLISFMKLEIEKQSFQSIGKFNSKCVIDLISGKESNFTVNITFLNEGQQDICDLFETPKSIIIDDYLKLFVKGEYADVTVECKSGEELKVHKCILTTRSEVFKKMLSGDTLESKTLRVPCSYDKEVMSYVLEYVYCGSVDVEDKGREVFIAADYYQLQGLMEICKLAILKDTTPSNAVSTLMFCHPFGRKVEDLKKYILIMISWNSEEVVNAKELMTLSEKLDNDLTQDLISAILKPMKVLKIECNEV